MTEAVALEFLSIFKLWLILLARVASGLDEMSGVERADLTGPIRPLVVENDFPQLLGFVPMRVDELGARPHVQFEERGVCLEKLGQFILGREDGPMRGELQIGHMIIPDRVMKDELVIALSPVVTHALVFVDHECLNAKHLEASSSGESGLTSTCENVRMAFNSIKVSATYQQRGRTAHLR